MNSPASLLSQLRIDRPDDPEPAAGNWNPRWVMAATISALVAGAVTWWILARSDDIPVRARNEQLAQVTPQVAAKATLASAGTAALDTSGYVVARRQATVSSKATGRVAEVLIEEGQRVEKGQIIARLDSSSTAAALAEAEARLAQAQADLEAARVASDDAYPIYRRNEQQHAAGLISSQAFDGARAVYNATRASHAVKETAVAVSRAELGAGAAQPRGHGHPCSIRRHSYRQGRPAGRDRLTLVRQQRFRAHRHRDDRRHGIAGSRGRRQRELHCTRATRSGRDRATQRIPGLGNIRPRPSP